MAALSDQLTGHKLPGTKSRSFPITIYEYWGLIPEVVRWLADECYKTHFEYEYMCQSLMRPSSTEISVMVIPTFFPETQRRDFSISFTLRADVIRRVLFYFEPKSIIPQLPRHCKTFSQYFLGLAHFILFPVDVSSLDRWQTVNRLHRVEKCFSVLAGKLANFSAHILHSGRTENTIVRVIIALKHETLASYPRGLTKLS